MAPYLRNEKSRRGERSFELNVYDAFLKETAVIQTKGENHGKLSSSAESHAMNHQEKKFFCYTTMSNDAISSIIPRDAFYQIDIDSSDSCFYPKDWIPSIASLNKTHLGKITWKASPLKIDCQSYFNVLHSIEAGIASTLKEHHVPFTKSVAQKLCRVDVNKTSALSTVFHQLGWFHDETL
ncbi:uncharacterized protein BX663DRAFT_554292 [Cokeromyces recurvatus]|uniref:uncharacterized protein n=1 Tax=Cokeromyces recurvatus TaxID=90255 RepID=UPI00221E3E97|nr:uncharacterized protein BX663DRAFT_555270 [Cokeromyces recurvatus]XP_051380096.1 uncharacterized protein BX663DRAFT_554292 [Cokeromyces recurvatus]KAI7899178.1 hypothetical protein BX663DRAFT_555270 [Cokeromyces recurvatus]KAI7900111.1 hypothetical protein BX663DRAFT_554292 [Cokeromyces recurvatus]